MKSLLPLLLCLLVLIDRPVGAAQTGEYADDIHNFHRQNMKMDYDAGTVRCIGAVTCRPEMRGRCGKRRGDWYGARQPVANATDARGLLLNYFAGQGYTVSEVTERRWGFKAAILDKDGKVVDRVMIDKRSGRIRSLY